MELYLHSPIRFMIWFSIKAQRLYFTQSVEDKNRTVRYFERNVNVKKKFKLT